jgi:hypothetical protein
MGTTPLVDVKLTAWSVNKKGEYSECIQWYTLVTRTHSRITICDHSPDLANVLQYMNMLEYSPRKYVLQYVNVMEYQKKLH